MIVEPGAALGIVAAQVAPPPERACGSERELDLVAYLRFASVYQNFDSLDDFEAAIAQLRAEEGDAPSGGAEASADASPAS